MNTRREHPSPERWALFVLDLLDEAERATLEGHLAVCDACRDLVDDERAAIVPAPGDAAGHIPAEIIAGWERAVADFGAVERGLYARHLETCTPCVAILRRLGHDPGLVRNTIAHRRPSESRVSRRLLGFAAAAAVVAVALLFGPQLFAPSREGPGGPTIARGPETPTPAPADSFFAPAMPGPGQSSRPDLESPGAPPSTPSAGDSVAVPPISTPSTPFAPPTVLAGGVPVLVRPATDGPAANPALSAAVARAIDAEPGLERAGEVAGEEDRFTVRATLAGAPSRAADATRPSPGGPRGAISWELVDRYSGERMAERTTSLDSAQAGSAMARISRQVAEAIARAPWAGRVRSADAARIVIETSDAGAAPPAVGTVVELYARGRQRIDAVTQMVDGYEWIRVARARVSSIGKVEIVAEPFDIGKGTPSLKDATLARAQRPQ